MGAAQQSGSWTTSIERAVHAAPGARVAVLDVRSGRMIASRHLQDLAHTLAAPGSTLKPLVLYQSLQEGLWNSDRVVPCKKNLVIGEHRLVCSHPVAQPFKAREALAWSCNSYFASLARTVPPGRIAAMLGGTGLLSPTRLVTDEAVARFRPPQTVEEMELAVLGVEGILVTPLELAVAYRWLALRMTASPASNATTTVLGGLSDSAEFGIADAAHSDRLPVAGKTGTAANAGARGTHGWFVGLAPASNPEVVLVVYVPAGRGADAARVAGLVLGNSPLVRK
jgi:cell division protein FtsI/penicillin-binding protein 2